MLRHFGNYFISVFLFVIQYRGTSANRELRYKTYYRANIP
jgi:hypothetical protein